MTAPTPELDESTHPTSPFGAAMETRDLDAATALLSPDVVFRSPAVFGE